MPSEYHYPVLADEAIKGLNVHPDSICVDMTLGRAGDSTRMLSIAKKGYLYATDKDEEALDYSRAELAKIGPNFRLYKLPFSLLVAKLQEEGVKEADCILFDIGVSSPQFDNPERGFSYKLDGPLDMRMDQNSPLTAEIVVNTYSEEQLRKIITEYGEDPSSYRIAHQIVLRRQKAPIKTTLELASIVHDALPSFVLNKKGHPAKQTFQAIRYEVNHELDELENGLKTALPFLALGGRLAVITFNSLEDKTVKDIFKEITSYPSENRHLPPLVDRPLLSYALVNRKPLEPSEREIQENPRSKSAKLRIIERTRKV